jgi:glycerate 2-kinase
VSGPLLVAPDKFKGTLGADEVAAAVAAGVRAAGREAVELPVADGGEGTARALVVARGGELRSAFCQDPLGREISAQIALLEDGETAVVEAAAASGLRLLEEDELDPWRASTAGTGQLIRIAAKLGARTVIVGAGGSATVDGGAGAIEAVAAGASVPRIVVACDVATPWERAAEVYGPQKGADPEMVSRLAERLDRFADAAPRDPRGVPMSGAAGGLAGGLWAHFDAELVPGAEYVLDAIDFDAALSGAAGVITGEGRLDTQTFEGKAVAAVTARARRAGVPCDAVVGEDALPATERDRLGLRRVIEAPTRGEQHAAGELLAAGWTEN